MLKQNMNNNEFLGVELFGSIDDPSLSIEKLKKKMELYNGLNKLSLEIYLNILYIVKGHFPNFKLDYLKVMINNMESYTIPFYDIINNPIFVSNNNARTNLNLLNYIASQNELKLKVLDFQTLDYVDYVNKSKIK